MLYINLFVATEKGPQDLASMKEAIQDKGQAKIEMHTVDTLKNVAELIQEGPALLAHLDLEWVHLGRRMRGNG
jgi:hypothetical protein